MNHARYRIKGEHFPGIIEKKGYHTTGIVYANVDSTSMEKLDHYEGEIYYRKEVEVISPQKGHVSADVYVVKCEYIELLSLEPWCFHEFELRCLSRLAASYDNS
jgi:gamma-glutamylcyclotransferase (GGCT)/AIG2-like uncharacterized protein YtfP